MVGLGTHERPIRNFGKIKPSLRKLEAKRRNLNIKILTLFESHCVDTRISRLRTSYEWQVPFHFDNLNTFLQEVVRLL